MSRKLVYNIRDFSGGITHNIRDLSDLSKCAHVSHFDIYRDHHRMYPMPGYIADMHDGSAATGMKVYGIKAFLSDSGTLFAVGTKSNGTGTKIVGKDAPTDASWDLTPLGLTIEGTYTLYAGTFLAGDASNQFFVTTNAGDTFLSRHNGGTVTDNYATLDSTAALSGSEKAVVEFAPDALLYFTRVNTDASSINGTTIGVSAKTTGAFLTDIQAGDEQVGLFGYRFSPNYAQLLIWDTESLLVDQNIEFGKGRGKALGYLSGTWVGIVDENLASGDTSYNEEQNGKYAFAVKYANGGSAETLVRIYGKTNTNGKVMPCRGKYNDAMLFEARVPTDAGGTTFKEGIWAVGKSSAGIPSLSLLLDTAELGSIEAYYTFGDHHFFAHAGDGSISRLDNFTSGTYDVAAVYETLFYGADTPNEKTLNGISVITENLPASGSVVVKYRTDENDSWTTLGTSSTTGTQVHSFTRTSSGPIGNFTEIQFRVEVTGNAPVKNIYTSLEELDTVPYDA